MKNAEKIITALKNAFPGHMVETRFIEENYNTESIFVDGKCVALFYEDFLQKDFDNPEICITIKAPLKNIKDFVNRAVGYEIIRGAVERGVKKWEEELQRNS